MSNMDYSYHLKRIADAMERIADRLDSWDKEYSMKSSWTGDVAEWHSLRITDD